jgi:hypothetical protein
VRGHRRWRRCGRQRRWRRRLRWFWRMWIRRAVLHPSDGATWASDVGAEWLLRRRRFLDRDRRRLRGRGVGYVVGIVAARIVGGRWGTVWLIRDLGEPRRNWREMTRRDECGKRCSRHGLSVCNSRPVGGLLRRAWALPFEGAKTSRSASLVQTPGSGPRARSRRRQSASRPSVAGRNVTAFCRTEQLKRCHSERVTTTSGGRTTQSLVS